MTSTAATSSWRRRALLLPDPRWPSRRAGTAALRRLIAYRALRPVGEAERIGFYGFGASAHILCPANLTRADGEEFLALAPQVPVRTEVNAYPLVEANAALADLRAGRFVARPRSSPDA